MGSIEIGKVQKLQVIKEVPFGLYMSDDERVQELLLPLKYIPENTQVGDWIEVFVYNDSENRPICTTLKPFAQVGEFASLTVLDSTGFGAFLDLGIAKDVFVPMREQLIKMKLGREYIVFLYIDNKTGRIVASAKWNKYIKKEDIDLEENQKVDLLIAERTAMGFKAIINQKYLGLIYANEVFKPINVGDKLVGYVKKVREENKIDLSLQALGYIHISDSKSVILEYLRLNNGVMSINDKSSSDEIQALVGLSKKAFKKTIGGLYRDRIIDIRTDEIILVKED